MLIGGDMLITKKIVNPKIVIAIIWRGVYFIKMAFVLD